MKKIILLFLLTLNTYAADTLIKPGNSTSTLSNRNFFLRDSSGAVLPAQVVYTTDGNGNLVPVASSSISVTANLGAPDPFTLIRNDYSSVNVTTSAYTQLVSSTGSSVSRMDIFDSSGQTLVLATGAAASEVDKFYIFPGGNGQVPISIPSGTRISIKAISANATVGEIDINFFE
jgi:hypothetical protein